LELFSAVLGTAVVYKHTIYWQTVAGSLHLYVNEYSWTILTQVSLNHTQVLVKHVTFL